LIVDKNSVVEKSEVTADASARDENDIALEKTDEALDEEVSQPVVVTNDIKTVHPPTFVPEDEWARDATMDANIRWPTMVPSGVETMHFTPRFSPIEDGWSCDCCQSCSS